MNTGRNDTESAGVMDSGFAPLARPGMTLVGAKP
jgi:hypothetical protein